MAFEPQRDDWRIYRADRITPRTSNGPRFTPRAVPGEDVSTFLSARLKGSTDTDTWPCHGDVILNTPATKAIPFAGDGTIEALGPDRCRLRLGSWSWVGLAATLARFEVDITVLHPPELRDAFAALARRADQAAGSNDVT